MIVHEQFTWWSRPNIVKIQMATAASSAAAAIKRSEVTVFSPLLVFTVYWFPLYWLFPFTGFPLNWVSSLMVFLLNSLLLWWFSSLLVFQFTQFPSTVFPLSGFPLTWFSLLLFSPLLVFFFTGFPFAGFPQFPIFLFIKIHLIKQLHIITHQNITKTWIDLFLMYIREYPNINRNRGTKDNQNEHTWLKWSFINVGHSKWHLLCGLPVNH